jgi:hypothetical protein
MTLSSRQGFDLNVRHLPELPARQALALGRNWALSDSVVARHPHRTRTQPDPAILALVLHVCRLGSPGLTRLG